MAQALSTIAFVTLFVLAAAAFLTLAHRALRPKEMHARSATALRELEPRGGRHRFHARLFESIALTSACMSALGLLLVAAATPEAEPSVLVVGGGAVAVAVWWAWRRGALRTVEAEPRHASPHGGASAASATSATSATFAASAASAAFAATAASGSRGNAAASGATHTVGIAPASRRPE